METVEMVFILIFGVLVMAFILAFGFGGITDMFCTGTIASTNKAVKDIGGIVGDVYNYGEGSTQEFSINTGNAKICFVNSNNPSRANSGWNPDKAVKEIVEMNGDNIWLYYNCGNRDTGVIIPHLRVSENFCIKGKGTLYFTNMGTYVSASN